jgi:hypothetical protein
VLVQQGRFSRTDVWASVARHPRFGIGRIDGVPAKLDLARDWRVTRLFVPAENYLDCLEANKTPDRLVVEALKPVVKDPAPKQLLREYLAHLGAEPDEKAPFEKRKLHYANIGRREADDYYWRCLLADAVARCGQELKAGRDGWKPTHIVTVASLTPAVVAMGPLAAGTAKECLLLHEADGKNQPTKAISKTVDRVRDHLRGKVNVTLGPIQLGVRRQEMEDIEKHLRVFRAGVAAEQVAYDLTPAYKSLALAVLELAAPGSWLLYCRHKQMEPDNRPEPETEHYDCWQKK